MTGLGTDGLFSNQMAWQLFITGFTLNSCFSDSISILICSLHSISWLTLDNFLLTTKRDLKCYDYDRSMAPLVYVKLFPSNNDVCNQWHLNTKLGIQNKRISAIFQTIKKYILYIFQRNISSLAPLLLIKKYSYVLLHKLQQRCPLHRAYCCCFSETCNFNVSCTYLHKLSFTLSCSQLSVIFHISSYNLNYCCSKNDGVNKFLSFRCA